MSQAQANRLLGYGPDARLLIVNADDFGLCRDVNDAILGTLQGGLVRSTTLMVPCPGAAHAMQLLAAAPGIAFGVHLTAICETSVRRWGPLTPRAAAHTLVDESGSFYSLARLAEFLAQADVTELEAEFRAQIETVLAANLQPTHLDWHCLHNGGRADIFAMTLALARAYGLALRVAGQPLSAQLQAGGLPTNDHDLLDSFRLPIPGKPAHYAQLLRELPPGLTEWAVHPGLAGPELAAMQPDGVEVRQTDYDFWMSPEAQAIVQEEGITLLDYRPLQAAWRT